MSRIGKILELKATKYLIGIKLPTNIDGHAGRALEHILEDMGIPINRGTGPDILNYDFEIKSRKISATSAQTIATMSPSDIINTPYHDSVVYKKFRQQLRVKTDDNDTIVSADIYDFDQPQIQELIEDAYEHARVLITENPLIGYTPYTGFWGYFEQTKKNSASYDFRLANEQMIALERMATSHFQELFKYAQ